MTDLIPNDLSHLSDDEFLAIADELKNHAN